MILLVMMATRTLTTWTTGHCWQRGHCWHFWFWLHTRIHDSEGADMTLSLRVRWSAMEAFWLIPALHPIVFIWACETTRADSFHRYSFIFISPLIFPHQNHLG